MWQNWFRHIITKKLKINVNAFGWYAKYQSKAFVF